MTGGDDEYGDAFKKAKLEHEKRRQGDTEAKRLQAEADADIAVLSDVVLPQLQAAAQKLGPLGGNVDIRQYGRTGKTLRPASVAFRIIDQQDQRSRRTRRTRNKRSPEITRMIAGIIACHPVAAPTDAPA
jgi:hypothetical protein